MENEKLSALRARIDAVDGQIIALLKERIGVVRDVGALKQSAAPGKCPLRPGREARQLRRVMAECKDSGFLPAAAAAIWRNIIMASLAVEGEIRISVYAPENQRDLFWLTREYFGPFTSVIRQPAPRRVLGDLRDGKAEIGVLPLLDDAGQGGGRWWPELASGDDQPKVFAVLPFVGVTKSREVPSALAVARLAPEESDDDLSLLALQSDDAVSQHRLQTALSQAGLSARWIEIFAPSPGLRWHVVEVNGFVTPENEAWRAFEKNMGNDAPRTAFLGAYATPVSA